MKKIFLLIAFISGYWLLEAQPANWGIQWQRSLGGYKNEVVRDILPTLDGGYLLVGSGLGTAKLNQYGLVEWIKKYYGFAIKPLPDSSYFVLGQTTLPNYNYRLTRLNAQGDSVWSKTYGGSKLEYPKDLLIAPDGRAAYLVGYATQTMAMFPLIMG